jgi:hypothetical protein
VPSKGGRDALTQVLYVFDLSHICTELNRNGGTGRVLGVGCCAFQAVAGRFQLHTAAGF